MTDTIIPTLYIIMRSDIPDMNPGKAMAQAAHAQADFDDWANGHPDPATLEKIIEWKEGRCFGRTLVLSATKEDIMSLGLDAEIDFTGVTVDPTYPWRNYYGETFLSNEVTCGWAFVSDLTPALKEKLSAFPLHK